MMNKSEETTVDFIVLLPNGDFLCRSRIPKKYRSNHILATAFSTRQQAEKTIRVMKIDGIVVKRKAILSYSETI